MPNPSPTKKRLRIAAENLPSRFTICREWQVRRDDANMNWMVYRKRDVEDADTGKMSVKWVHTGTYHQDFGDALKHIASRMAGRGIDKRSVESAVKEMRRIQVAIESSLPLTGEEAAHEEYLAARKRYAAKLAEKKPEMMADALRKLGWKVSKR